MKKRIVSLLLALALLVLPVVSAGAAQPAAADLQASRATVWSLVIL